MTHKAVCGGLFLAAPAGSETLKGWGIGATYSKENDWYARIDYARRIGAPEVPSGDAMSRDRFWFFVGKMF